MPDRPCFGVDCQQRKDEGKNAENEGKQSRKGVNMVLPPRIHCRLRMRNFLSQKLKDVFLGYGLQNKKTSYIKTAFELR